MKKLICILGVLCCFIINNKVLAENFREGDYLNIYVNKVKNNKTYYLNMQPLINTDSSTLVYCLEPFEFFENNTIYHVLENDFSNYKLSKDQLERIRRITDYGYGYNNRLDISWYAITQVLIWKTVDPDADIYFTDRLNGNRIANAYSKEIEDLEKDIAKEGTLSSLTKEHYVNYNMNYTIGLSSEYYEVISTNHEYEMNNNLTFRNIKDDILFTIIEKNNNHIANYSRIYESNTNQDIYMPGKFNKSSIDIKINVIKGSITLDIRKDINTYSSEADFKNTCYGIYKKNTLIKKVCANDDMLYKVDNLELGNYSIKELSVGIGYELDNNTYNINLTNNNLNETIILNNNIIKNDVTIIKKYCDNSICQLEDNAKFTIYDKDNNLLNIYNTKNGSLIVNLGYGNYNIIQVEGKEGYDLVPSINVSILDKTTEHYYELFDNKIEIVEEEPILKIIEEEPIIEDIPVIEEPIKEEEPVIEEPIIKESIVEEEEHIVEEIPPSTAVKYVAKTLVKIVNYVIDCIRKTSRYAILL